MALYKLEQTDRNALLAILGLQLYESEAAKRTTLRKKDPGVIGDSSKAIAFMAGS